MNSNIKLPDDVLEIFSVIKEYGARVYVVGGCVRDSLMGRTPHDWDICTPALVCELLPMFEEKGYSVIPTGLKHGTITVHLNGNNYEITTFRKDGSSSDHRHPDNVEFTSDLELDLERRDFTINAMAYNPEVGLIDLFGGLNDIRNKVIRCVENPRDRFSEDALRIMRAVRFACQLGFSIHPSIGWEISYTDICEDLKYISAERINSEFCKMIVCDDFYKRLVWNMRLFKTIFPELEDLIDNHRNDFLSTVDALKNCKSKNLITRLSIFFKIFDVDKVEPIMRRLRFDCNTIKKVKELVDFKCPYKFEHPCILQNEVSIKIYLMLLGVEQFKRLIVLYESYGIESNYDGIRRNLNKVISSKECYLMKDLAINGDDLIANGFTPGKDIGEILNELLLIVMCNNNLNTKEELLILAQELKKERNEIV